jgi:hypothetical protein
LIAGGTAAADSATSIAPIAASGIAAPEMVTPGIAAPGMAAPALSSASTSAPASQRRFAIGYLRGTGLGYYGASLATAWTDQLTPQLHVFGFFDDGSRGFALVPALRFCFTSGVRASPCVTGGLQYLRMWFGDATGGGFGGYGSVGVAVRFEPGLEVELGVGLHGKESITGGDGVVSVAQAPTFGPHWDAGLRYWF